MLCNGSYVYKDMYDIYESESIVLKYSDTNIASRARLSLKVELSRYKSRVYFAEEDIVRVDLEKKVAMGSSLSLVGIFYTWLRKVLLILERHYPLHQ